MSRNTKDLKSGEKICMHRKVVAACMAGILMSLSVVPVSASTLSKAKNAKTRMKK